MKGKMINSFLKETSVKVCSIMMATALVFGVSMYALDSKKYIPELVTITDVEGTIEIPEDDTPLAAPKVTTSTKTSTKTQKITMPSAATSTYNRSGGTTTRTTTTTTTTGSTTTKKQTVVATSVLDKYTKGSKIDTRVTTTKTTITTTVTGQVAGGTYSTGNTYNTYNNNNNNTQSGPVSPTTSGLTPRADARVNNAFNTLGFRFTINPNVSYSGLFDARTRTITLKKADDTAYHEIGHFLAFIAGNYDTSGEFQSVFAADRAKYTAYNKGYVLSSASEYFAESFKNYCLNPSELQSNRPSTYRAIQTALARVTSTQVSTVANVYSSVWR